MGPSPRHWLGIITKRLELNIHYNLHVLPICIYYIPSMHLRRSTVYNTVFVFAAHSLKNDTGIYNTIIIYKNRCSARIHNVVLFA